MLPNKFDFMTTYASFAARLKKKVPHDKVMSLGVGGEFENMGQILLDLTRFCGLQPDHSWWTSDAGRDDSRNPSLPSLRALT
jgi:hypothetical protein